jgi:hypothetical protein
MSGTLGSLVNLRYRGQEERVGSTPSKWSVDVKNSSFSGFTRVELEKLVDGN